VKSKKAEGRSKKERINGILFNEELNPVETAV
jgi:hypothetical protein